MKIAVLRLPVTERRLISEPRPLEYPDELVPENPVESAVSLYVEEDAVHEHQEELVGASR